MTRSSTAAVVATHVIATSAAIVIPLRLAYPDTGSGAPDLGRIFLLFWLGSGVVFFGALLFRYLFLMSRRTAIQVTLLSTILSSACLAAILPVESLVEVPDVGLVLAAGAFLFPGLLLALVMLAASGGGEAWRHRGPPRQVGASKEGHNRNDPRRPRTRRQQDDKAEDRRRRPKKEDGS